jgi:hypothetical protein
VASDDTFLVVAALLGIASYVLVVDQANGQDTGDAPVSGSGGSQNGFAANNPLNLRYIATNPFNGQTGKTSTGIGIYDTLSNGVRAAGLQLTAYYNRGLTTITQIISTWAPASENPTSQYIANVANAMGDDANEPLSWPDDEVSLIMAMAQQETGNNTMTAADVASYIAS